MITNINFKLKIKKTILLTGDILCLYFSLFLTLLIRFQAEYSQTLFLRHVGHFSVIFFVWLIIIFSFRFYEANKPLIKSYDLILNIFNISIINFFLSVLYFYIIPQNLMTPKTILVINIIIFAIIFYLWRLLANKTLYRKSVKKNCLVITDDYNLINDISKKPELELNIKTCVNVGGNINIKELKKIHFNNIYSAAHENKIQTIIVEDELLNHKEISKELFKCLKLRLEIMKSSDFYEKFLGKVSVENINKIWLINNLNENKKWGFDLIKNILDKSFGFIFLIISIIIVPFIIIAIKLDSKGSVFFTQIRTGRDYKEFLAIKFRSMKVNAETNGPQWASDNDSRITKVGKFLRKTRLDEIPQLINILRGEMSLVGPRPERPEFIKQLKERIPFYNERLLVKPGLTGWAQINYPYGNTVQDALEKLRYDLYYIKNRSFMLDLSIVLKTIHTILRRDGK